MKILTNHYDRRGGKLFSSMGPLKIYGRLAMLTFYTPYWRKICRLLSNMRMCGVMVKHRFNEEEEFQKGIQQSIRDTNLPALVKAELRNCIKLEFNIDSQ